MMRMRSPRTVQQMQPAAGEEKAVGRQTGATAAAAGCRDACAAAAAGSARTVVHLKHLLLCLHHDSVIHAHLAKLVLPFCLAGREGRRVGGGSDRTGRGTPAAAALPPRKGGRSSHLDDGDALAVVLGQDVVDQRGLARALEGRGREEAEKMMKLRAAHHACDEKARARQGTDRPATPARRQLPAARQAAPTLPRFTRNPVITVIGTQLSMSERQEGREGGGEVGIVWGLGTRQKPLLATPRASAGPRPLPADLTTPSRRLAGQQRAEEAGQRPRSSPIPVASPASKQPRTHLPARIQHEGVGAKAWKKWGSCGAMRRASNLGTGWAGRSERSVAAGDLSQRACPPRHHTCPT